MKQGILHSAGLYRKVAFAVALCVYGSPVAIAQTLVQDTIALSTAEAVGLRRGLVSTAVAPIQVLQGDALHRMGGIGVADALRHFSGLQIKDYGGIGGLKTINVRSLGTHHTGVALDGVALHNAQNGQIDLGRFGLDDLEAVAVGQYADATQVASASSLLSGALVQLQSRRPRFAMGRRQVWTAAMGVGSFDTYRGQVSWAHQVGERGAWRVALERLCTSGKYDYRYRTAKADGSIANDTSGIRQNGDVCYTRAEANYYLTPHKAGQTDVAVKAYIYASERGLPGAVVRGLVTHADRQWDRNVLVQATLRQPLSRVWQIHAIARWANDYLRYRTDPAKEGGVMHIDHRYYQNEGYLSALMRGQWQGVGEHTLSVGMDGRWNTLTSNRVDFVRPTRWHAVGAVAYRYQWQRLTADAQATWGYVNDQVIDNVVANRHKVRPTVAVAVGYAVGRELTLRVLAKHSYRLPTLNDMYYTEVGNSDLRVERTMQWNAGVDYHLRRAWGAVEGSAEVYLNHVADKIVAVPTSNQFRWTMMNLGQVRIVGSEWRVRFTPQWRVAGWQPSVHLNYTYQHATDRTDRTAIYYGHQIAYIPRHAATFTLQAIHPKWWASATCIYTGIRYDQQTNIAENFVPAWYTTDVAVGYTPQHWRITAEVNNLFGQRYEVVKGYPLPGRNWRVGVQYNF